MNCNHWIRAIAIGFLLLTFLTGGALAQVVEQRQGEANPSAVLFRATLYGAGTGLLLGGAVALADTHDSTWQILRWSVAGGTVAGFLVGLVYVTTRQGPSSRAEIDRTRPDPRLLLVPRFDVPASRVGPAGSRDVLGRDPPEVRMEVVRVRLGHRP